MGLARCALNYLPDGPLREPPENRRRWVFPTKSAAFQSVLWNGAVSSNFSHRRLPFQSDRKLLLDYDKLGQGVFGFSGYISQPPENSKVPSIRNVEGRYENRGLGILRS
jgi:hypothetical protein